jgi:hypothetical protein
LRILHEYTTTVEGSDDLVRKANYRSDVTADVRSRNNKLRTNLMIKGARYFVRVRNFASDLLEDLEDDGGVCKNGDEVLEFQELKGIRYLAGLTVWHGLQLLRALSREIVNYLNVPDASLE